MVDSPLFLYSKAFTFQFSKQDNLEEEVSGCLSAETLSAAIIYNIALIINLRGFRRNSSILLKKALDLYMMSMGLLQHESSLIWTTMVARSLAIACSNNTGHLALLLFDYEQAQSMQCTLQELLTTPFSLDLTAQEDEQDSSYVPDPYAMDLFEAADWQGFTGNVLFMQPPTTAPSA
jgi:hypothetical protein